jgi:GAF domain-containing protein
MPLLLRHANITNVHREEPPVSSATFIGDEAASLLEQLARALRHEPMGLQSTLDAVVEDAVSTIEPAQYAGVILIKHGVLSPQATLGEPPHELDLLQQQLDSGPCSDCAVTQQVILIHDMAADDRWPAVASRAQALGVMSMLCMPLWVDKRRLGALSLYSDRPRAFASNEVQLIARLFATLAALALADAERVEQLQTALSNRDLIGQAKGILIERHRLTPDVAFRLLSAASQEVNVKLVEVARHLVETGELMGQVPG